jgi:hypothetical protein
MKWMVGVSYVNYPISPIDEECPWCHRSTSCYFWSFIILFFQRNCTTSVFSDWIISDFSSILFFDIVTKKGGWYDYFNPVTFICAFPMQRAFVKVIIFNYGFCLERGLLLRISRSGVNLLYLAFVLSVTISSCSVCICSLL